MSIELLERKIAPASFTFVDVDGDNVTVTTSKGSNAQLQAALTLAASGQGQQLQQVDLSTNAVFAGTTLTISAVRTAGAGNGFANVTEIDATGRDLGNVTVRGDLGTLTAGDANAVTAGLGTLTVESLGRLNAEQNINGSGVNVTGKATAVIVKSSMHEAGISMTTLGNLTVGGSIIEGSVFVTNLTKATVGADVSGARLQGQTLGALVIKGSLVGIDGGLADNGQVEYFGNVGTIQILGDVIGNEALASGSILIGGKVTSIAIGGSLIAGDSPTNASGLIKIDETVGTITIGGDIIGGAAAVSGRIDVNSLTNNIALAASKITVGGSLIGGEGQGSGRINVDAAGGDIIVNGGLIGGVGISSGVVNVSHTLKNFTSLGSIQGGTGDFSGRLSVDHLLGRIAISGDLRGGVGNNAGFLGIGSSPGASISLAGSIIGAQGDSSGSIDVSLLSALTVGGNIIGGVGVGSGVASLDSGFKTVLIKGSVIGGDGQDSGQFQSPESDLSTAASLRVLGGIIGGDGVGSGQVDLDNRTVGTVFIGGSVIGGFGNEAGLLSTGIIATRVEIRGGIIGSSEGFAGLFTERGFVGGISVGTMIVGGSLIAGTDSVITGAFEDNGAIRYAGRIGSLTIQGSVLGSATDQALITAGAVELGFATLNNSAIGTLTVLGNVERASILGGYGLDGNPLSMARAARMRMRRSARWTSRVHSSARTSPRAWPRVRTIASATATMWLSQVGCLTIRRRPRRSAHSSSAD